MSCDILCFLFILEIYCIKYLRKACEGNGGGGNEYVCVIEKSPFISWFQIDNLAFICIFIELSYFCSSKLVVSLYLACQAIRIYVIIFVQQQSQAF